MHPNLRLVSWMLALGLFAGRLDAAPAPPPARSGAGQAPAPAEWRGPLVGDPAPALDVAEWLKGEPLARLAPGRVYVLDIWAPWCGPCIGGMAHLSELEARHPDDLSVIGLSGDDEYGSTLESARKVVGREGDRIRYRIAWDRAGATYKKWMARENVAGWPWCFVVDREGRVAWIGHPEALDPVLERVLANTWNLDSARVAYRHRATGLDLSAAFYAAYKANRGAEAETRYAALRAFDPAVAADYSPHYFKLLLLREKRRAAAYAFAREALGSMLASRPEGLSRIAAVVADTTTPPPLRDLRVALDCARRATALQTPPNAGAEETLARVLALRGEWDDAIAAQQRAIAASDSADVPARAAVLARYRVRRI